MERAFCQLIAAACPQAFVRAMPIVEAASLLQPQEVKWKLMHASCLRQTRPAPVVSSTYYTLVRRLIVYQCHRPFCALHTVMTPKDLPAAHAGRYEGIFKMP